MTDLYGDLTPLDLLWDGRFFGSMVRDCGGTPLGGYVRFCCGCEWRTTGHRAPCVTHEQKGCERT